MATFASFATFAGTVCASRGAGNILTNTAFGCQALLSNTTGYQNAAFGYQALRNNTTGRQNTAIGVRALRNETTGVCNTAVGTYALYTQNGGNNNTAIGFRAGFNITTGGSNTLVGNCAGHSITTGGSNVAVGYCALFSNQTSSGNTAIGFRAIASATSLQNTAIGWQAGCTITTGACNTIIGTSAGNSVTTASNTISISRKGSTSNTNNHTLWGNSGITYNWIQCQWTNVSDCRDKTCVNDLDEKLGLTFLRKLIPVSFRWDNREQYVTECGYEYGQKDGTLASRHKSYGFEAQQMKQVLQELDIEYEALGYDPEKDAYRITYEELIASLIKGVQETTTRLETLETLAG
jgi:hypothetical protein